MRQFLLIMSVLLLAGCSSVPNKGEQQPVPEDRVKAYQQPYELAGIIQIDRDIGYIGGGCYVAVLIDREVVARIGVGETARFHVPAGRHIVGVGIDKEDDTLCGYGRLNREVPNQVMVHPGETVYFNIVSEASSGFDIRQRQQP